MSYVDTIPYKPFIVFLADDDGDDIELFKEALTDINPSIKLEHFSNGSLLIKTLVNYLPDLLFLDLDMPSKNGLQCLQEIRKNPSTALLPSIVFSSTMRPIHIEMAYEMGAHLFFIKPDNYGELVRSLRCILNLDWSNPEKVKEKYCSNGTYKPLMKSEID